MTETATRTRPIGRDRIVSVTEARLRDGREIRVADICAEADVSPALIYKYFEDREDLIAEAYARIYAGQIEHELETVRPETFRSPEIVEHLYRTFIDGLQPDRAAARWSKLEALSHARTNPGVAMRIGQTRERIIDKTAAIVRDAKPEWSGVQARAFAIVSLGMMVGVTAMLPEPVGRHELEETARMMAELVAAPFLGE